MNAIPWYKKCLGYIYPIVLAKHQNDRHTKLKIKYYQGQIQLESEHALYSDGYRYSPFRIGFQFLDKKGELKKSKTFLLLGAGLGSALYRLQTIYKLYPDSVLVEYDADICSLSQQYMLTDQKNNVQFVVQDAQDFLSSCSRKFDLIGIDLFENLENSFLISQPVFWLEVLKVCTVNTNIIVNTIFLRKEKKLAFENLLAKDFIFDRINRKPNYFYILKRK